MEVGRFKNKSTSSRGGRLERDRERCAILRQIAENPSYLCLVFAAAVINCASRLPHQPSDGGAESALAHRDPAGEFLSAGPTYTAQVMFPAMLSFGPVSIPSTLKTTIAIGLDFRRLSDILKFGDPPNAILLDKNQQEFVP